MANKIPNLVRVEMLKDFKVDERFTAKKGKFGTFDEDVVKKMIKAKAAVEIVTVNSYEDIKEKAPYVAPEPEKNPTQEKQEAAAKPAGKPQTKEEKTFK